MSHDDTNNITNTADHGHLRVQVVGQLVLALSAGGLSAVCEHSVEPAAAPYAGDSLDPNPLPSPYC